jgi:hypothetical protein
MYGTSSVSRCYRLYILLSFLESGRTCSTVLPRHTATSISFNRLLALLVLVEEYLEILVGVVQQPGFQVLGLLQLL